MARHRLPEKEVHEKIDFKKQQLKLEKKRINKTTEKEVHVKLDKFMINWIITTAEKRFVENWVTKTTAKKVHENMGYYNICKKMSLRKTRFTRYITSYH